MTRRMLDGADVVMDVGVGAGAGADAVVGASIGMGVGVGVGAVVAGLYARRGEIEDAIYARVAAIEPGSVGEWDAEYALGLRAAVAGAVEYVLRGLELGGEQAGPAPVAAVAQARRAMRSGVDLNTVLRRYTAGYTLLGDFLVQEVERGLLEDRFGVLRGLLRTLSGLLERLTAVIADEYERELERAGRSREQRRLELVRALLAGEGAGDLVGERAGGGLAVSLTGEAVGGAHGEGAGEDDLGYGLDAHHVGVVAHGAGAREVLRELARALDRMLLCVAVGEETVWGWLGGRRELAMVDLRRVVDGELRRFEEGGDAGGVWLAIGEPAWGLAGWRLTHQQAQAAALVAMRSPRVCARYAEVALLACALKDEMLAGALIDVYAAPLRQARDGGVVFRRTLRAYLAAECNVSSAAAALGVVRHTVEKRLRAIEELLGRSLHPCPPEIEVALELEELGGDWRAPIDIGIVQRRSTTGEDPPKS